MFTSPTWPPRTDSIQASVESETASVHGLTYEHGNPLYRQQTQVMHDLVSWYELHKSPQKPAVGLFGDNDLTRLLTTLKIPFIYLKYFGLHDLESHPIGTIHVMSAGEMVNQWCRDHSHGKDDIWHDFCARVLACTMSCWLRKRLKIQPALHEVNAQRILWQKRADELLDIIFCDDCIKEKNKVYREGEGLDWYPDCCLACCKRATYVLRKWKFEFTCYEDEPLESMRKM